MTPSQVHGAVMLVVLIVGPLVLTLSLLRLIIGRQFARFARRYPPRVALAGAVRREFQSISINTTNLGGCVHLEVDEQCLHIRPAAMARWIGAGALSLPWDAMRPTGVRRLGWSAALVEGVGVVRGPRWALDLARTEDGSNGG